MHFLNIISISFTVRRLAAAQLKQQCSAATVVPLLAECILVCVLCSVALTEPLVLVYYVRVRLSQCCFPPLHCAAADAAPLLSKVTAARRTWRRQHSTERHTAANYLEVIRDAVGPGQDFRTQSATQLSWLKGRMPTSAEN